uniref:Myomesin-1 n=1 Tax=Geotrypetes seraphini TaxID=260995 RepID=A0A6P8QTI8_GEOSA|nr:myomesin-1 isoform X2 [Geotrypetes seraphini]
MSLLFYENRHKHHNFAYRSSELQSTLNQYHQELNLKRGRSATHSSLRDYHHDMSSFAADSSLQERTKKGEIGRMTTVGADVRYPYSYKVPRMSVPFYQKRHKHYDLAYRDRELQSTLDQYDRELNLKRGRSSAHSSLQGYHQDMGGFASHSNLQDYHQDMGGFASHSRHQGYHQDIGSSAVHSSLQELYRKQSSAAHSSLQELQQEQGSSAIYRNLGLQHITGITDTEEERIKEAAGYVARRNLFATGEGIHFSKLASSSSEHEEFQTKSRRTAIRDKAEYLALKRTLAETEEYHKKLNEDSLLHAPEFHIKPRSHTVWEKQNMKFHCTVSGWPAPRVTWYKNYVPINDQTHPGKYIIDDRYGIHSLQINNCDFDDTAQYRASAMNVRGEQSALASLVVKRYKGDFDITSFHVGVSSQPPCFGITPYGYRSRFDIYFLDKFDVSFGREGETMSLGATVVIHPTIKRFKPEIQWYRNGVLLSPSKWLRMYWSGERASLTLTHLNKEDEGLYSLRVVMGDYYDQYSAYVFVGDADAAVGGAPAAPLDVECLDANKDYVIVSWKQPAVDGGSPILGYFIDKCEVGTTHWSQCNTMPVKFARFPVTGLIEGRSYVFRVRAVNKCGIGNPSRVSEPVAALDPADRARLKSHPSAPWTGQIIVTEEEPAEGVVPGPPSDLSVTEATKNYVVLSWNPPGLRGHEGIRYYVEKCVAGTDNWQRVNTEIPVKSPRFAIFDLDEGKSYSFRVRSCNSAGVGEPSEATEATLIGDKLDIPKSPGHPIPSRNTDTSVVLTWEEPKDAKELVGYYIEGSVAGSGKWEPCNNNPVKDLRFTCQGLLTGENYTFRVRAVNAAGLSDYSSDSEPIEVKAALAVPSPPYDITVLESVHDSMVLGWKPPKVTGGAEITGYYINYCEVIDEVPGEWHEANIKAVTDKAYRILDLKENMSYQFKVAACNQAGVGAPSLPSKTFKCEEWTIAVPGPPYSLSLTEVRKDSMVLLWEPPIYTGRTPIIGFYVDVKETKAKEEHWKAVNEIPITNKYFKIQGLKDGVSYVFRVRAANQAGVGKPSDLTDPMVAQTRPGTKEIVVEVDDNGVISLNFESDQLGPGSEFIWSKNYEGLEDPSRVDIETKGGRTKLIFKEPSEKDLGIYSCVVTDTDGVSSSYNLDEEELKRLLQLSHDKKFPVVPLKTELAAEVLEKGQIRFWLQAEKLSNNAKVNYVFNDKEIFNGEKYKMHVDHNTGIVEMFMDKLEDEDEGTYTFQLQDGKATNQSSLVLIGDVFKKLQKEATFQRQEWLRKQGPHFVEQLGWEVTSNCNVLLKCKVANIKKETSIIWYKDEREIMVDEKHDFKDGVCTLLISEISKKDAGVYEVILKDDRGKDKSVLKLQDAAFADVMNGVCKAIAQSASELKLRVTGEGLRLYCFVTYYVDDLKLSWLQNKDKINYTERVKSGVTGVEIWLQINEPTPKDKGNYVLELFDGKTTHTRSLDLTGQAFDDALAEYQRLREAAIADKLRARILGGLPDVVTIQEGKSLNLTCNLGGDPLPEVIWLKNEKPLIGDDHCILKIENGKHATFTVTAVHTGDSGRYSIRVKNKYGTETSDFTVSVFIPEGGEEED